VTNPAPERNLDSLMLGGDIRLEELVDREALGEMVQSFYGLFRVPLRIFNDEGLILADASEQQALFTYLNTFRNGRRALSEVVDSVKNINPGVDGEATHRCLTGAIYQITSISYDGRQLGRMILGPFLPPKLDEAPRAVLDLDPAIDAAKVKHLMAEMPRAREDTVARIARHLKSALDLILFSGHKALLTSNMHLAAVRESFRELEQKNAHLQEAFDRLKELDRLKSNFLATVSHELRTPLTSIIGYSEMLAEGIAGDLTGEQGEFVGTIREKGEQLLELIKGLLDLSKLESGTMSLRKASIDVGPIVEDVAQTVTPAARKKGVEIEVNIDGGLPLLWADADRLRQVLLNLTENAIKFTPEKGRVTLSLGHTLMEAPDADGDAVVLLSSRRPALELRVADTGIGIPETERQRVFDAFYQVDSSSTREQGGTGLGLSIVKRLVDGHDGTVHIEDNTPHGAVFVVTIPCRRATLS
jgi:signal transduction histidine kinase